MPQPTPLKAVETGTKLAPLEGAIETFIQGAGQVSAALLGMINKVGGQIYALLYLNEEPLSLDDIAEKLSVSKSNVSINIRLLEDFDLVRKVWVKGSRRDYYSAERNYPKKIIKDFLENIRRSLTEALTTIERTRLKIGQAKLAMRKEETSQADFMLEHLDRIALFYEAAHQYFEDFFEGKPVDIELLRQAVFTSNK